MYCDHAAEAARLTERIEWTWTQAKDGAGVDYQNLDILGRMRDRETKAFANLGTKLRLTPQSQEPPPDRGKRKPTGPLPWQSSETEPQ
jgi:hypothetical protein